MKLMLDPNSYSEKPRGNEIGVISKRIMEHPVDINVEQLAKELESGKTIVPATFKSVRGQLRRAKENWESQQVIALDFDEGLTLHEALTDEFFINNAVFIYTTFSHTDEHHKFRVVFVLDEPVTEYKHFEEIMIKLFERYPYADKSCRDGSRLFFGGKKVIPINYNNRLRLDEFIDRTLLQDIKDNLSYMSVTRVHTSHEPSSGSNIIAKNIELIKSRDIKRLQDIICPKPIAFVNRSEAFDYLKKQDLRLFLGVETLGNFIDIFHDENNPSASIYQSSKDNGHWLYKCHSSSSPFVGTIIHIVQKLLNCSLSEASQFLMKLYKIKIDESEGVKKLKDSIEVYKMLLMSEDLEEIHPYFYKVFNRHSHLRDLYLLLDLAKEFVTNECEPRIIFHHGIRTLAESFGRSISSTGTRMNFFVLFKLVKKLDEAEIPEDLLWMQKMSKKQNGYQYRNSTYEIPLYTYDLFCQIDGMCKIWLEKGCTSRTISYEGILRTFGRDEANRVFPQDKDKEISELNEDIVSRIHHITMQLIEYKGWATEQEILSNLNLNFKGQQEFKKTQFKRCICEMLDAYDLEIVPTNKNIKKEMGITEEYLSKYSFPKIIRRKKDLV
jgi:hypothetical protein